MNSKELKIECIYNEVITRPDGSHFKRTVDCPEVKDGKNKCEKCGWNPEVEKDRKSRLYNTGIN